MLKKYKEGAFGRCPRVHCSGQAVLPVGQSDMPRLSTVKIFCPMCWDIYFPRSRHHSTLDGAYWGTTFPHLFLHMYSNLVPVRNPDNYTPRIFGFKIHKSVSLHSARILLPCHSPPPLPRGPQSSPLQMSSRCSSIFSHSIAAFSVFKGCASAKKSGVIS